MTDQIIKSYGVECIRIVMRAMEGYVVQIDEDEWVDASLPCLDLTTAIKIVNAYRKDGTE